MDTSMSSMLHVDESSEDGVVLKTKRPRITLEPYDERKVEVIHDDGQEIYEPYVGGRGARRERGGGKR